MMQAIREVRNQFKRRNRPRFEVDYDTTLFEADPDLIRRLSLMTAGNEDSLWNELPTFDIRHDGWSRHGRKDSAEWDREAIDFFMWGELIDFSPRIVKLKRNSKTVEFWIGNSQDYWFEAYGIPSYEYCKPTKAGVSKIAEIIESRKTNKPIVFTEEDWPCITRLMINENAFNGFSEKEKVLAAIISRFEKKKEAGEELVVHAKRGVFHEYQDILKF